jgi:hypothetical protein
LPAAIYSWLLPVIEASLYSRALALVDAAE